jgi:hypothetical protein
MKTDREVLEGALELISRDKGWCQGSYCQGVDGSETSVIDIYKIHAGGSAVDRVSFCLEGAIRYSAGWFDQVKLRGEHMNLARQVNRLELLVVDTAHRDGLSDHRLRLSNFNDDEHTSQSDAILALKKTIEVVSDAEMLPLR